MSSLEQARGGAAGSLTGKLTEPTIDDAMVRVRTPRPSVSSSLHLPSIFLLAALLGLVGLLLLARSDRGGQGGLRDGSYGPWMLAVGGQALASAGHALRGELPPFLVFSAVNALQIAVLSLLALGARRMLGGWAPGWLAALPPALWLTACLVPGFLESQRGRVVLFSPVSLGLLGLALRDLLLVHHRQGLRSALDLAAVLAVVMLAFLALFLDVLLAPGLLIDGWGVIGTAGGLLLASFAVALPFLFLAIRRETERAAVEAGRRAALAAGRAEVARLHQGLPAIIFLCAVQPDGTARLSYRSGDVEAVMGWTEAALLAPGGPFDRPGPDGVTPRAHRRALMRRTLEAGVGRAEWLLPLPGGDHRHLRVETRLLGPAAGGGMEVAGYLRDTTEERRSAARAMAASRLASLGEMGVGIAHEVKQPLQAMSLAAELAIMALPPDAPPRVRSKLDTILQEAGRAAGTIEHLRRFARGVPEGAVPEAFALAGPVHDALRLVRGALAEAGVRVEIAVGEERALGVPALLEQVLVSLLLNARDALAEATPGAARHVRIVTEAAPPGQVALVVEDTGGGIPAEILPRLFEPFVTTKAPDRGRGLALAAAHGLMQAQGGGLSGDNAGAGARFTLTLPRAPLPRTRRRALRGGPSGRGAGPLLAGGQHLGQAAQDGGARVRAADVPQNEPKRRLLVVVRRGGARRRVGVHFRQKRLHGDAQRICRVVEQGHGNPVAADLVLGQLLDREPQAVGETAAGNARALARGAQPRTHASINGGDAALVEAGRPAGLRLGQRLLGDDVHAGNLNPGYRRPGRRLAMARNPSMTARKRRRCSNFVDFRRLFMSVDAHDLVTIPPCKLDAFRGLLTHPMHNRCVGCSKMTASYGCA